MLFREHNPLAAQLSGSHCIFRLSVPEGSSPEPPLLHECERIGAVLVQQITEEGRRAFTVAVSHARLDAFGGMFLLSTFGAQSCARAVAAAPLSAEKVRCRTGEHAGYHWYQFVCDLRGFAGGAGTAGLMGSTGGQGRTLTQRILERFARLPVFGSGRVGIAVAKDDPRGLTSATYLGNSLVIVELAAEELPRLVAGSKEDWRRVIEERSNRLSSIALRRPGRLGSPEARITVSSVGEVERLGWAAQLDPEFFEMIPTPVSGSSANVVLWGNRRRQALALCGRDEHPLLRSRSELCAAWAEALALAPD
jgi:hypothetical protein